MMSTYPLSRGFYIEAINLASIKRRGGDPIKYELNITIGKDPSKPPILRMKTISLREKILSRLFGPEQKLTVLIPGRRIETVDIKEVETDAETQQAAD